MLTAALITVAALFVLSLALSPDRWDNLKATLFARPPKPIDREEIEEPMLSRVMPWQLSKAEQQALREEVSAVVFQENTASQSLGVGVVVGGTTPPKDIPRA